ncbi:class I SAM-dependent DNA methyltransferase [Methanocalculus sp.]|uniref:class I SAM-dependent DNA methyltransferase n=1 Tax=Methanocalculus sp. TaxID=2004547 RepID=UPI00262FF950|nr:class I SAM-dependent DNA methyltransferase [Methanocalculus sp.]MDG6249832.1 class I SAM-dependent DNA methyltransferase [Methanocalculus sp.]
MESNISIPAWVDKGYSYLWDAFEKNEFRIQDAAKVLEGKTEDTKTKPPALLSKLRKVGLLNVRSDNEDARKKIYSLIGREEQIAAILSVSDERLTRDELTRILKRAADIIRTRVDYKFILLPLFLKRISDKWEMETKAAYDESLEDGYTKEEACAEAKKAMYHSFDLPEEYLWENLRKDTEKLPETFSMALKEIGNRNPELRDVFDTVDFIQFTQSRENAEILRQLVELFSEKKLTDVSADILGDAYEWLLQYFAPQKAKEGEVYTPREVIQLLVEALDPHPGESVYDPAAASNGMLIISHKHVVENYGPEDAEQLFLYGQEANAQTLAYGRMNMYIHGIRNVNLAHGDTLLYPKFKKDDGTGVKQFDVVIANPPWNQDGYEETILKKGEFWKQRYSFGFINRQSADWAWVQHMLASAKEETGRVGVVIDTGCLFRGGKEKAVRQKIIDHDLLECIILLPEKLFYNTGAPGAIMILRRQKPEERKGKVLFINASNQFEKHPNVRKLNILADENITTIVTAYEEFAEDDGFARLVPVEEIAQNDYSLNVTLYVFPNQEKDEIDLAGTWAEIRQIEEELQAVDAKIEGYLREIGYKEVVL